ncbi:MAG TPA: hypothetical protein DCW90_08550 [Lachnospiraceae bacterium]|nr:hypothetical protein [Lachnospiraceae bacterium]
MRLFEMLGVIPVRHKVEVIINDRKYIGRNFELIDMLSQFRYRSVEKIIADKDVLNIYCQ